MFLSEARDLYASIEEPIVLPETGEGELRRPRRGKRVEGPPDTEPMSIAVGIDRVAEMCAPVRRKERRDVVVQPEARAVSPLVPPELHILSVTEEVRIDDACSARTLPSLTTRL